MKKLLLIAVLIFSVSFVWMATETSAALKTVGPKTVTVTGKLDKIIYYHPNGQKLTGYILKLDKPVNVKTDDYGDFKNVKEIQVYNSEKDFKTYVGKKVKVTAIPTFGENAWWARDIAFRDAKVSVVKK